MNHPEQQLRSIHAMLAAGHRSVCLERHSLLLVGGVGGFLAVASQWVVTADRFPDTRLRGLALLVWLAFWLGGVSALDHRLTRRVRAARGETLPFAQGQITRAWWMLLAMGCLGSFAMFFHGGGTMVYALWIVLLGLGIYLFGLFARPLIEWIGLATILLGVAGLAAGLPYGATRWLAASCFAVGMPLAGWLDARLGETGLARRTGALLVWLVLVAAPPLAVARLSFTPAPQAAAATLPLAMTAGERVLHLPAGTQVPLQVDLASPILAVPSRAGLELTLRAPVEVALRDGSPDGRYRIGDGPWHEIQDGVLHLRIDRFAPTLDTGVPVVRATASFGGKEFGEAGR